MSKHLLSHLVSYRLRITTNHAERAKSRHISRRSAVLVPSGHGTRDVLPTNSQRQGMNTVTHIITRFEREKTHWQYILPGPIARPAFCLFSRLDRFIVLSDMVADWIHDGKGGLNMYQIWSGANSPNLRSEALSRSSFTRASYPGLG